MRSLLRLVLAEAAITRPAEALQAQAAQLPSELQAQAVQLTFQLQLGWMVRKQSFVWFSPGRLEADFPWENCFFFPSDFSRRVPKKNGRANEDYH